ncbi:hypothetical protein C8J56DRAFT_1030321 [Mycena floridula]|nr:hypothetical protein C8J56DRAFT_1030321 [Mycena floridula]
MTRFFRISDPSSGNVCSSPTSELAIEAVKRCALIGLTGSAATKEFDDYGEMAEISTAITIIILPIRPVQSQHLIDMLKNESPYSCQASLTGDSSPWNYRFRCCWVKVAKNQHLHRGAFFCHCRSIGVSSSLVIYISFQSIGLPAYLFLYDNLRRLRP